MTTATRPPEAPHHNNLTCYKQYRCRRPECVERNSQYQNARYRKRGYGTWQPLLDAEPIRKHLENLRAAGVSYVRVAELAGLYPATVGGFLYPTQGRPPKARVRPEIAAKILAVQAGDILPAIIDATGTRRRLQALGALGWPMKRLAPHIGVHPTTVGRLARHANIYGTSAVAVAVAYEKLRNQRPEDLGVPARAALRMRDHAAQEGWNDPTYWDDMGGIDDPAFNPAAAEKPLKRNELAALRKADVEHLAAYGIDAEEIAERVGLTKSTVHALVEEWRTGTKRDRKKVPA